MTGCESENSQNVPTKKKTTCVSASSQTVGDANVSSSTATKEQNTVNNQEIFVVKMEPMDMDQQIEVTTVIHEKDELSYGLTDCGNDVDGDLSQREVHNGGSIANGTLQSGDSSIHSIPTTGCQMTASNCTNFGNDQYSCGRSESGMPQTTTTTLCSFSFVNKKSNSEQLDPAIKSQLNITPSKNISTNRNSVHCSEGLASGTPQTTISQSSGFSCLNSQQISGQLNPAVTLKSKITEPNIITTSNNSLNCSDRSQGETTSAFSTFSFVNSRLSLGHQNPAVTSQLNIAKSNIFTVSGNRESCSEGSVSCTPQKTSNSSFVNSEQTSKQPNPAVTSELKITESNGITTSINSQNCCERQQTTTSAFSTFSFVNRQCASGESNPNVTSQLNVTESNISTASGNNMNCSEGSVFTTPKTTISTDTIFTNYISRFGFGNNQQSSGQPGPDITQQTSTESKSILSLHTCVEVPRPFGNSQHSTAEATSQTAATEHNELMCNNVQNSAGLVNRSQDPSCSRNDSIIRIAQEVQPAASTLYCTCCTLDSKPNDRCGYHRQHIHDGHCPFASQRPQTVAGSSDQHLPSTLPHTGVESERHTQLVWGRRLFPTRQQVTSGPQTVYTGASLPQVVCSVTSSSQPKLCFGAPGAQSHSTAVQSANQKQPATGTPPCSTFPSLPYVRECAPHHQNKKRNRPCFINTPGCSRRKIKKYLYEAQNVPRNGRNEQNYTDTLISFMQSSLNNAVGVSQEVGEGRTPDLKVVVIPVSYPHTHLSEDNYTELQRALLDEMFCPGDRPLPQFLKCCFEGGALVLECETVCAKNWLIEVVPNLKSWKGPGLKVGDYKDCLFLTSASLKIPPALATRSPKSVLDMIKKQNKDLAIDQWKIIRSEERNCGKIVHVALDPAGVQKLKNNAYKIFLGLEQVFVKIWPRIPFF